MNIAEDGGQIKDRSWWKGEKETGKVQDRGKKKGKCHGEGDSEEGEVSPSSP